MSIGIFAKNFGQLRYPEMGNGESGGDRQVHSRPEPFTDFGNGIFIVQGKGEGTDSDFAANLSKLLGAHSGSRVSHLLPQQVSPSGTSQALVILESVKGFSKQRAQMPTDKEDLPY